MDYCGAPSPADRNRVASQRLADPSEPAARNAGGRRKLTKAAAGRETGGGGLTDCPRSGTNGKAADPAAARPPRHRERRSRFTPWRRLPNHQLVDGRLPSRLPERPAMPTAAGARSPGWEHNPVRCCSRGGGAAPSPAPGRMPPPARYPAAFPAVRFPTAGSLPPYSPREPATGPPQFLPP